MNKIAIKLLSLAAFLAISLFATNAFTQPRIHALEHAGFFQDLLFIFPNANGYQVLDNSEAENTIQIIQMFDDTTNLGFVYYQSVQGFVDYISYFVGIDINGNFTNFLVTSSYETQGFGSRIETTEWSDLIIGHDSSQPIDVLTGATGTTQPIIEALLNAHKDFQLRSN